MKKLILAILLMASSLLAQDAQIRRFTGAPSGGCNSLMIAVNQSNGDFYTCYQVLGSGVWIRVGTSGAVALGTANQIAGMNAAGTANEWKTFSTGTTGTDFNIAHGVGTVIFHLPTASLTNTGKISLTGDKTWSGVQTILNAAGSSVLNIDGADANNSWLGLGSSSSIKWLIGSNGNTAGNLFSIGRATGLDTSTPYFSIAHLTGLTTFLSTDPIIRIQDTDGDVDTKIWDIRNIGHSGFSYLQWRTIDDALAVFTTRMALWRSGGLYLGTTPTDPGAGNLSLEGKVTTYNAITAVSNGVPSEYGTVDLTAQTAIAGPTTIYTTPAAIGQYRVSYTLLTKTAGNAVNLALVIGWTTPDDSSTAQSHTSANVAINTVGANTQDVFTILCKASTTITWQTTLSGAIGTGTFDVFVKVEKL